VGDELGKMEPASAPFRGAVVERLGRNVAVAATAHLARHRFTDALKRQPDVQVVRVTEGTRDALHSSSRTGYSAATRGSSVEHDVQAPHGGGGLRQAGCRGLTATSAWT